MIRRNSDLVTIMVAMVIFTFAIQALAEVDDVKDFNQENSKIPFQDLAKRKYQEDSKGEMEDFNQQGQAEPDILEDLQKNITDFILQTHTQNERHENTERIIGGKFSSVLDFPWQVLVLTTINSADILCGGSVISQAWIMSAAHCLFNDQQNIAGLKKTTASKIELSAGVTIMSKRKTDPNVQQNFINRNDIISKKYLFIHNQFRDGAFGNNDIAIIKLKKLLTYSSAVKPIALATSANSLIDGQKLDVSGWGITSDNGPTSNHLKSTSVFLYNWNDCKKLWGSDLTDNMLCQRRAHTNRCHGDSGGAVVGNNVQIGIISFKWPTSCASTNPNVMTNVAKMKPWIQSTISRNCKDKSTSCYSWMKYGFCTTGNIVSYVKEKCPKSCQLCVLKVTCKDNDTSCASWKKSGYCTRGEYVALVKALCPRSCKVC